MSTQRTLFLVLVTSGVMLTVGIGPLFTEAAHALPPAQSGGTILYPGRLDNEAGQPVTDGAYDFTFALYDAETNGTLLWSEAQTGVMVKEGAFVATLGSVTPIPKEVLNGSNRWLAVSVRGPGEKDFSALTPRQRLSAASPASPSAGPACAHTHLGETWSGSAGNGLQVQSTYTLGNGLVGIANNGFSAYGVLGLSTGGVGVYGSTTSGRGVVGESSTGIGVYASGAGVGHDHAALMAYNTNTASGIAAFLKNNSALPTLEIDQLGSGGVMDLQNNGDVNGAGGGNFIAGYSRDNSFDLQFRITSSGQGRSDVGWTTPAEDFAEMLPAVAGLEPGDVLVISPDGALARSTSPYQTSVAGAYSTQPGFIGGQPVEGPLTGTIPLAVVGIVPVKVSAENGPIRPGDLLVTSSTPGHAMKANPNPPQSTVIGKALGKWDADTGVIKMLATLQ